MLAVPRTFGSDSCSRHHHPRQKRWVLFDSRPEEYAKRASRMRRIESVMQSFFLRDEAVARRVHRVTLTNGLVVGQRYESGRLHQMSRVFLQAQAMPVLLKVNITPT